MKREERYPTITETLAVILVILGTYQACQCVAWSYDAIVSYVAADIKAKQDGGRNVTECTWDGHCYGFWRKER